jgi:hypothetical protein
MLKLSVAPTTEPISLAEAKIRDRVCGKLNKRTNRRGGEA